MVAWWRAAWQNGSVGGAEQRWRGVWKIEVRRGGEAYPMSAGSRAPRGSSRIRRPGSNRVPSRQGTSPSGRACQAAAGAGGGKVWCAPEVDLRLLERITAVDHHEHRHAAENSRLHRHQSHPSRSTPLCSATQQTRNYGIIEHHAQRAREWWWMAVGECTGGAQSTNIIYMRDTPRDPLWVC